MDKRMTLPAFSDELVSVRAKKKELLEQIDRIAFEQQGNVCDEVLVPARLRAEPVVGRVHGFVPERPDLLLRLLELGGYLVGRQARNFAADVPFHRLALHLQ